MNSSAFYALSNVPPFQPLPEVPVRRRQVLLRPSVLQRGTPVRVPAEPARRADQPPRRHVNHARPFPWPKFPSVLSRVIRPNSCVLSSCHIAPAPRVRPALRSLRTHFGSLLCTLFSLSPLSSRTLSSSTTERSLSYALSPPPLLSVASVVSSRSFLSSCNVSPLYIPPSIEQSKLYDTVCGVS